jgi:TetR/AcrR family transcriptional regulator, cholesterol catabolism regulator
MTAVRVFAPPMLSRRAEICRTAAQIFQERGYDATSVSDIARALGITKAGLYHYFESKEALLFEITAYGLDRVRDDVMLQVRGIRDPEERLRQLVVRHANIATHGRGAVAQLVDEVRALPPGSRKQIEERMRAYFDLVRDTLRELQAAGRLRQVDTTVATFSLIGTILWLPRWFRQNGRLSQEAVAKEIANIALGGLLEPTPSRRRARRAARTSAAKASSRPRRAKARKRT